MKSAVFTTADLCQPGSGEDELFYVTVKVNVRVAEPDAFVAVTTYSVADLTVVGEPDNNPVDVLNDIPAGAAGEIE